MFKCIYLMMLCCYFQMYKLVVVAEDTAVTRPTYQTVGDVTLAMLFPITQERSSVAELYIEAMIYAIQRVNLQLNVTLGYDIYDTQDSAEISSEIITSLSRQWRTRNETTRKVLAVITDDGKREITEAISHILHTYNTRVPLIIVRPQGHASLLNDDVKQAATNFIKTFHHSWIAVHKTHMIAASSFIDKVRNEDTCIVDGLQLSDVSPSGINPILSSSVRWHMTQKADLEVVISGVNNGINVINAANDRGIGQKTWVIINDDIQPRFTLKRTRFKEHAIFLLSRSTNSKKYPEKFILEFQQWLISKSRNKSRGKRPRRLLPSFATQNLRRYFNNYPCSKNSQQGKISTSLNIITSSFNMISAMGFALRGLQPNSSVKSIHEQFAQTSVVSGASWKQACGVNNTDCSQGVVTLSKMVLNDSCNRWSFQPVATWSNKSGWYPSPRTIDHFKSSGECADGMLVHLPTYLQGCLRRACLRCPKDWKEKNNTCRLCTFNKCSDITLTYVGFLHPFALVITSFCALGEIVVLLVIVIFVRYRRTPVVKSSNRMFNFVILTILGFWFAVIPSFLTRPNFINCNIFMAFFPMAYATVSALLLTKTIRLLLIFNSMKKGSKWLGNASFFVTTVLLIFLQLGFSSMNFVLFPVHLQRVLYHDQVLLHCAQTLSPLSAAGFSYNCFLSCACVVLAFKVRKLPQNFNEAKNMFFTIVSYSVSWTIVIFGYYTEKFAEQQTAIISLGFAIGAFLILACLFFPKVYVILFFPQLNTKSATIAGARRYSVDASVNIGTYRVQRSRSSTVDVLCPKANAEQTIRPRTISDSSCMQLVSDERHKMFITYLTSSSPTSIGTCVSTISQNSSV